MKTAAPEKKSVKTLKGQLFGAVSMMLVAAIALGTSTYAWFVQNSTVEVSNMQLTVDSSAYLQIAVKRNSDKTTNTGYDAKNPYTEYKNLLAPSDIIDVSSGTEGVAGGAGWTKMFENKLSPASTTDGTIGTFFYSQGAMQGTNLSTFIAAEDVGQGGVKKIPLSFKSSTPVNVYFGGLSPDGTASIASMADLISQVTANDATSLAQAELIKKALRVAVVPDGGTAVIFQFSESTEGGGYNTYYDKVTVGGAPFDTIDKIKAYSNDATGLFAGVATLHDDTIPADEGMIKTVGTQTAIKTTDLTYLADVQPGANGAAPTVDATGKTELFTLTANTALDVDVYIWLEGVDKQCTVDLASFTYNLRLPFAAAPTTP